MRIAIHPALQRRGLGHLLLEAVATRAREQAMDYLGSSFGADPPLLSFWRQAGYRPARLSIKASAASGSHSAIVLLGLSASGTELCELASQRFQAQFPAQLGDHLHHLDAELALALLHNHERSPPLDQQDWLDILAFSCAKRVYETCLLPIYRLSRHAIADPACPLDHAQRQLLLIKVLQQRSWSEVAAQTGLSGRGDIIASLRGLLRVMLFEYAPDELRQRASSMIGER